jgi:hypothetical protein
MAIPTIEEREEYVGYAEHCVKLARQTNDQKSRRDKPKAFYFLSG